jgi:hypothetical protein
MGTAAASGCERLSGALRENRVDHLRFTPGEGETIADLRPGGHRQPREPHDLIRHRLVIDPLDPSENADAIEGREAGDQRGVTDPPFGEAVDMEGLFAESLSAMGTPDALHRAGELRPIAAVCLPPLSVGRNVVGVAGGVGTKRRC